MCEGTHRCLHSAFVSWLLLADSSSAVEYVRGGRLLWSSCGISPAEKSAFVGDSPDVSVRVCTSTAVQRVHRKVQELNSSCVCCGVYCLLVQIPLFAVTRTWSFQWSPSFHLPCKWHLLWCCLFVQLYAVCRLYWLHCSSELRKMVIVVDQGLGQSEPTQSSSSNFSPFLKGFWEACSMCLRERIRQHLDMYRMVRRQAAAGVIQRGFQRMARIKRQVTKQSTRMQEKQRVWQQQKNARYLDSVSSHHEVYESLLCVTLAVVILWMERLRAVRQLAQMVTIQRLLVSSM